MTTWERIALHLPSAVLVRIRADFLFTPFFFGRGRANWLEAASKLLIRDNWTKQFEPLYCMCSPFKYRWFGLCKDTGPRPRFPVHPISLELPSPNQIQVRNKLKHHVLSTPGAWTALFVGCKIVQNASQRMICSNRHVAWKRRCDEPYIVNAGLEPVNLKIFEPDGILRSCVADPSDPKNTSNPVRKWFLSMGWTWIIFLVGSNLWLDLPSCARQSLGNLVTGPHEQVPLRCLPKVPKVMIQWFSVRCRAWVNRRSSLGAVPRTCISIFNNILPTTPLFHRDQIFEAYFPNSWQDVPQIISM